MSLVGEFGERVYPISGPDQNTTSDPTIAPARPAARYVFLSTEGHTTVTAVSSNDFNFDAVNEHISFPKRARKITIVREQDSANTITRSGSKSFPASASGLSIV